MLKTIIFDMDGVIVDSEPLHHAAYHAMFAEVGISVSTELYQTLTGRSTINLCRKLKDQFEIPFPAEELVQIKRKHFDIFFEEDVTFDLIDGVRDLIEHYRKNDLSLVLASSSSMPGINRIFDKFDLHPHFKAKISGADLAESKPHPEIFLKAAEAAGSSPDECLVIEDAMTGVKAANAAGIFCVGYKNVNSKNQDLTGADLLIEDFRDIYLNRLEKHLSL